MAFHKKWYGNINSDFNSLEWSPEERKKERKKALTVLVASTLKYYPYFSWISVLQVDSVFDTFDQFFNLSPEVKAKCAKKKITVQSVKPQNGWDAVEVERFVYWAI